MYASRPRVTRAALVVLLGAIGLVASIAPRSAVAATTVPGSVTLVGEQHDWVSRGITSLYDGSNAKFELGGTLGHATVTIDDGITPGGALRFDFVAPRGQALERGTYVAPVEYPVQDAAHPALAVSGDGRGCGQTGSFVVKDVHADGAGQLDRLWVLYVAHCAAAAARAFGEIRLGQPLPATGTGTEPAAVDWPATDPGRSTRVVRVTVVAGPTGAKVTDVAFSGAAAGEFAVTGDRCSGKTLVGGGRCDVLVSFAPSVVGPRSADLVFSYADGSVSDVGLSAYVHGGTTRVDLQSDPGDGVGEGRDYAYVNTNGGATIWASGTSRGVSVVVDPGDGIDWTAIFTPGPGASFTEGTTYAPVSRAGTDGGPGLEVWGNGWACNTLSGEFTVTDVHFDADGQLLDFAASVIQRCDGGQPALRGSFQFRSPKAAPVLALNTAPPTVSGDPLSGTTLRATPGAWDSASTVFGYQWQRCASWGCGDIPGATDSTYRVAIGDVGYQLAVETSLTNAAGQSAWVRSVRTAVVPQPPVAQMTVGPTVPADPIEGAYAAATSGSWTNSPTSYAYQWSSCGTDGCREIAQADWPGYTPGPDQVGRRLTVSVIAMNAGGLSEAAVSAPSNPVVPPAAPVNLRPPAPVGPVLIGSGLGSEPGTWSAPVTVDTFQWLECDAAGSNCFGVGPPQDRHYIVTRLDVGHTLRISETVSAEYSGPSTAVSQPTSVIPAAPTWLETLDPSTGIPQELERLAASESLAVPALQRARAVGRSGLVARVECSVACTVLVTVTRADGRAGTRSRRATVVGSVRVQIAGGRSQGVHVAIAHNRPGVLVVTSTAVALSAPHDATPPTHRSVRIV